MRFLISLILFASLVSIPLKAQVVTPTMNEEQADYLIKECLPDCQALQEVWQILSSDSLQDYIATIQNAKNTHINVVPKFTCSDTALIPALMQLYFDIRKNKSGAYIDMVLTFKPTGSKWSQFDQYKITGAFKPGPGVTIPPLIINEADTILNKALAEISNLLAQAGTLSRGMLTSLQKLSNSLGIAEDTYFNGLTLPEVAFTSIATDPYGFDTPLAGAPAAATYDAETVNGTDVKIPWKSAAQAKSTSALAAVRFTERMATNSIVEYRSSSGLVLTPQKQTDTTTLLSMLPTGTGGEKVEAYYVVTDTAKKKHEKLIRTLQVESYEGLQREVVVVPVGNVSLPADFSASLATMLTKAYSPAAVSWSVSVAASSFNYSNWDTDGDNLFTISKTLTDWYSSDMDALIAEYKDKTPSVSATAYYLFVLPGDVPRNKDFEGYMPFKSQWGFVFYNGSTNYDAAGKLIAHELGHGAFRLEHITDPPTSTTDNLMDYADGTRTYHSQWDYIYDPSFKLYLFGSTDDAAAINLVLEQAALLELGITETGNRTFLAPSGKPFTLPSNINTLQFITKHPQFNIPDGALVAFRDGDKVYLANYKGTKFEGYINEKDTKDIYKDLSNSYTQGSKVIIGTKSAKDCSLDVKLAQLSQAFNETDNTRKGSIVSDLPISAITAYKDFPDESACYTAKAKAFKEYCKGHFDASQTVNVDNTVAQIQLMGDKYDDYEKLALSNNPYNTWVNTSDQLAAFKTALLNYYQAHKNAPKVDNPNCTDCPKYPIVGDAYWDEAGRNWVYWEGNKWKDLSGEFCEDASCNNDWKTGFDVQVVHKAFYDAKLVQYENNALQASLGGINEEFKQQLWRSTQFITVHALKDNWKDEQVGDSWWVPVWGSLKSSIANIKVANGDMTYYTKATLDGVFAATDVFLVKAIATGIYKVGIKKLIIEGGAKQITKQLYYTTCKKAVTLRLAYTLSLGTPEATTFFNKQLAKTIEIYDISASRYIKFDPATGEALSGKFVAGAEQSITYESYGKISIPSGLSEVEQANVVVGEVAKVAGSVTKIDNFVTELTKVNLPPSVASTFENSIYKTVSTKQGITLNRAFGNQAYLKGGFATTKANATRSELALLDEWNNSMRFEATIDVPSGQTLNIGKVAPQTSTNGLQTLAGGGDQILLPQNWNYQSWVTKIVDKTTGIEYTFSQFQAAFPNIITP